jgi:molybdopterin adenylyltransferase
MAEGTETKPLQERRAAVVTVSDSVSAGTRVDTGGENAAKKLTAHGFEVAWRVTVPDERPEIAATLRRLCEEGAALIVTTGGTGLGPRDVTPEATRDVIQREIPGMAEAMRMEGLRYTPFAMTSRQVVGVSGTTLIINLPGSPRGVEQCLDVVLPVVPHVLDLLHGRTRHK